MGRRPFHSVVPDEPGTGAAPSGRGQRQANRQTPVADTDRRRRCFL